jgi:hypothetical protein
MGNYVIGVGNYVIVSPSKLGNYMIADNRVRVITVEGSRDLLHGLEALDETPLADAKPVLDKAAER